MANATCFECGEPAKEVHHVVPKSSGGTRTVTLCLRCHDLAHGRKERASNVHTLIKKGIRKARAQGKRWGRKKLHHVPIDEVRDRINKGESLGQIAKSIGIPKSTIHRQLKQTKDD